MWWPFKKKDVEDKPKKPDPWKEAEARAQALLEWRGVGEEFTFLGRRMVVTQHSHIERSVYSYVLVPALHARYADDVGVIHTLMLTEMEALALRNKELLLNNTEKA